MITWNYRVIHVTETWEDQVFDDHHCIKVIYYQDGVIASSHENPHAPIGDDPEDLKREMELMMQAFEKPVIHEQQGKLVELGQKI
jgi:predicted FMN-binding regulatory protein PaiB